tara:strand:+ start:65 stop:949 length:885 start_codon:yes stop_codon:yes gene_type:complete
MSFIKGVGLYQRFDRNTIVSATSDTSDDLSGLSESQGFILSRLQGMPQTIAAVAEMCNLDEEDCLNEVDELIQAGLVNIEGHGQARLPYDEDRKIKELPRIPFSEDVEAQERRARNSRNRRMNDLRRDRRLAKNPMVARLRQAKNLFEQGELAFHRHHWQEASNTMKLVLSFGIMDKQMRERAQEIIVLAQADQAEDLLKKAEQMATGKRFQKAADLAEKVVELCGNNSRILERAALLLTKADRDTLIVWTRLLAQYEKREEWYQALRAADEILKLKPLDGAMRRKYEELQLKV